ncbi:MAG TPA: tRNA (adenosine(37)-N6)-threonylcarbamoyltransferase complex dimerization subunit type 1 TsaB [Vicinamibacteria bacterium]|nr:tRNA (adenosine(37)-N6)-threonylcarbamoyltransferase complex dimerization subunit type 1 TsaB [Vicinamibacteria bacterium]
MRVLAVDTTTPRGSIAVAGPEGVLAEARVLTADGHSRWLLSAASALLAGLGLDAREVDAFAVTIGPGSFTGLRVGLGSVQGLAVAAGRPCVGLATLDVLAASAAGAADTIVALLDAFRGEVYAGVYDGSGRLRGDRSVGPLSRVLEGLPPGTAFVGEIDARSREAIGSGAPGAVFPAAERYLAGPLALQALLRVDAGDTVPPSALRPLYLRGADVRPPRP